MAETAATNGWNSLMSETFAFGRTFLEQKAQGELAELQARQQIEQQSMFNNLAQKSNNLGPNDVSGAEKQSVQQTALMQGPIATAKALSQNAWAILGLVLVVGLVFFIARRK